MREWGRNPSNCLFYLMDGFHGLDYFGLDYNYTITDNTHDRMRLLLSNEKRIRKHKHNNINYL